jgi:anti-sigma factor RsiW
MNSDTQLKVQAYLDNELSPGEARKVAGLISSDREAQELYSLLRATRELLVPNEPEIKIEESRDFYWSKIQRQVESAQREPAPQPVRPLWIRLLAPLAGTAALFALLLSVMNPATRVVDTSTETLASRPIHGEVEDLAPDVSSVTFRSEQDGVTVVWLSSRE